MTPVQVELLRTVTREWKAGLKHELRRWGRDSAALMARKPFVMVPDGARTSTVLALEKAGLLRVHRAHNNGSDLRRGAYGRWIGGTRTRSWVTLYLAPTSAGARI